MQRQTLATMLTLYLVGPAAVGYLIFRLDMKHREIQQS